MKDGEFTIKLAEDNLLLRATPHALRTILTKYGGVKNVLQKIYLIEEEVMFDIIVAALSGPDPDGIPKLRNWKEVIRENIFSHGIINLVDPMTEYVMLLANGGRHAKKADSEDDQEGKV